MQGAVNGLAACSADSIRSAIVVRSRVGRTSDAGGGRTGWIGWVSPTGAEAADRQCLIDIDHPYQLHGMVADIIKFAG